MTVEGLSIQELALASAERSDIAAGAHRPERCLKGGGRGPSGLIVSNSRLAMNDGHAFVQPSLTAYYQALLKARGHRAPDVPPSDAVWLPKRRFEDECLVAADGSSVLGQLAKQCSYVIVEDQDVQREDLVRHLRALGLYDIAAIDMTKAMGLISNYSYLLWPAREPAPPIDGERFW